MPGEFKYDIFLNHSAKDKATVRVLAERLRKDGLQTVAQLSTSQRPAEQGAPLPYSANFLECEQVQKPQSYRRNCVDAAARSELQQLTEHVAQRMCLLTLDLARRGNPCPSLAPRNRRRRNRCLNC